MTGSVSEGRAAIAAARIAVVSASYAPEETGIAPYAAAYAEHLADVGSTVTAYAGMPHYPEWQVWDGYRGRLRSRERLRGVDVRRFRNYVPSDQTAVQRALYEASFLANAALSLARPRFDLVIAVVPAVSGAYVARGLALQSRCPYAVVVQDLSSPAASQSGITGGRALAGAATRIEAGAVRGASVVAVVSDGFRPYLTELGVAPDRVVALPNWSRTIPGPTDRASARADLAWADDEVVVLHAGNMGFKQGLSAVVDAARVAARTHPAVRFVLMGGGSQRRSLEQRAAGLANLTFLDGRYGQAYADALHAADVLLVNERASVVDMSLPSKLTSYFLAGQPVLAASPAGGTTAREIERAGAGIVVAPEDPAALLAGIDALTSDRARADQHAASARRYAEEELSAAAAHARLERLVLDLLAQRPHGRA